MANVPSIPTPTAQVPLTGRHLLQSHACFYPPDVTPADVLEVDFDVRAIGADGVYLIEYPATGDGQNSFNCAWHGVRKFRNAV